MLATWLSLLTQWLYKRLIGSHGVILWSFVLIARACLFKHACGCVWLWFKKYCVARVELFQAIHFALCATIKYRHSSPNTIIVLYSNVATILIVELVTTG